MKRSLTIRARLTLVLSLVLLLLVGSANAGIDDYPDVAPEYWKSSPLGAWVDTWRYYTRFCTSFVAWRLHSRNGFEMPSGYGNAGYWGGNAQAAGYTVNTTPAIGAVAYWSTRALPPAGHVAWVEEINGTSVTIEEYNVPGGSGNYSRRTIAASNPTGYIHFKDLAGPTPPPSNLNSSTPSIAVNPNNGLASVLAQGPSNSLYAYWQSSNGAWNGPWGINGGSAGLAYSGPAIAIVPSTGLGVGVCRGPSNSLYNYWQNSNGSWNGPGGINGGAPNMCYSDPAIAVNNSNGQATVLAQGPSNSLYYYWQSGGNWYGPGGINGGSGAICYSKPAITINQNTGLATAAAQGPSNSLYVYWQSFGGTWNGPLQIAGSNTTYSAPAIGVNPSNGSVNIIVQGPSNTLYVYWSSGGSWYGPLGINGGATNLGFSNPGLAVKPSNNMATAVAVGPSNSLYAYWQNSDGSWPGPLGINGGSTNMAYSSPTIAFNPNNGIAGAVAVGPSHSLYYYWQNSNGSWNGPLGIAGPNTAY